MEINEIIKSGNNVMLVVSSDDLMRFATSLIEQAHKSKMEELAKFQKEEQEEKFLTTDEVKQIFGVCDSTLWSWHKHGLLCHRKFGRKNVYALSDIRRFMNEHAETETSPHCSARPFILASAVLKTWVMLWQRPG